MVAGTDGPELRDLMARWSAPEWRAQATAWITAALGEHGISPTGPVEQPRIRFWGTALTVPTDAGLFWFKCNHPAQSFEAGLVDVLGGLAPGRVLPITAVDPVRGWMLTPDQGPTLAQVDGDPRAHRVRVVGEFAVLQRALVDHAREVVATGVTLLDPRSAPARLGAYIDALAALPAEHPFALDRDLAAVARGRIPALQRAAQVLASSGIPLSLEHNDLHDNNAFPPRDAPRPLVFFDFGDAVWGHPFASLFIPLSQVLDDDDPADPRDDPHGRALVEAYLAAWADLGPPEVLLRAVDAALLLAPVHKLESWWRLARTTPAEQLEPYRGVREYVLLDRFPNRLV